MGQLSNWGKGETGICEFMPTVWHQTDDGFPVVNYPNLVCTTFKCVVENRKDIY